MQTNRSEGFHGPRRPSSFGEQGGSKLKLYWQLVAVIAGGLGRWRGVWGLRYGIGSQHKALGAALSKTRTEL